MDETAELAALHAFLRRYEADRAQGRTHDVEHYAAAFPTHAEAIRAEFAALQATPPPDAATLQIGPYEVVRELGRGGQAVVYLARDGRLRREVALKVLPRQLSSVEQELRLQREAMTSARLEDSGICPIYEVGHDGAHAFLAMRYVAGETLAARIERARAAGARGPALPLPELLQMFERLCGSLHRAHEAGIVHRDLKPGNIMLGDDGVPVLLDFGLAVDVETDGPLLTRSGDLFGTPAYLPPERLLGRDHGQRRGGDRRWDLWALGACLHEACTLQRAFQGPTLDALYRAILNDDPPPLRSLVPELPRDLGHVLAACLDKAPERRYQTAADLAADLRAVRLREPVRVKALPLLSRAQRWHRRHAVLATSLWLCAIGLCAVIFVQRSMLREVRAARDEVQGLNDFLVEKLLLGVTPREARGRELTAAEIFERAERNVADAFPGNTHTAGLLQHVLGRAFRQLGRRKEAAAAFERAVAIRTELFGADGRETLQSRRELALARKDIDQIGPALAEARDVLASTIAQFGELDADVAAARDTLSELLAITGDHVEAERQARLTLAARQASLPPDHPKVLAARHWVAKCLIAAGRRGDAEPILREVLAARRATLGPDAIEVEQSLNDLATMLHDRASYERLDAKWGEAETIYLEDLELARKLYPKTNPAYATVVNNVASFFSDRSEQGDDRERQADYARRSEAMFRESLALREAIDGPDSTRVATVCTNLCSLLTNQARHEEALAMIDRALRIRTRVFGEDHRDTIVALNNRAIVLREWKGPEAAIADLVTARTRALRNPAIDPMQRNMLERSYVVLLDAAGRDDEAIAALNAFWPAAVAQWGANSSVVRNLASLGVRVLLRLRRPDEAAIWQARSEGR